jgi:hypothetical protein
MELSRRADLLDALVTPVREQRRALPCSLLRTMLLGESLRGFRRSALDQALLVGAVFRGVLSALRADMGDDLPVEPGRKRWDRALQDHPVRLRTERLAFEMLLPPDFARPTFHTREFLLALPTSFVQSVVSWAPPVVSCPAGIDAPAAVLGNLIPAFLGRNCLPGETIRAFVLSTPTSTRFSPYDLIAFCLPRLDELVESEVARVMKVAPHLHLGEILSGRRRARVARVRQQAREGSDR